MSKIDRNQVFQQKLKSPERELNPRPRDYKSRAPPD